MTRQFTTLIGAIILILLDAGMVAAEPAAAANDVRLPRGAVMRLGGSALRHGIKFEDIAFSPDGKTIASAHLNQVCLWDGFTGSFVRTIPFIRHNAGQIAWKPDGSGLVVCGYDGKGSIIDLQRDGVSAAFNAEGRVNQMAIAPDGKLIATGGTKVQLWNAVTGELHKNLGTHGDYSVSIAFSSDGKRLLSSGADQVVRIWSLPDGEQERVINVGADQGMLTAAFSPDGKSIITGGPTVILWETETAKRQLMLKQEDGSSEAGNAVFSPDGGRIAVARPMRGVALINRDKVQHEAFLPVRYGGMIDAEFSSDGKRLLVYGMGWYCELWDVEKAEPIDAVHGHRERLLSLAVSSDGSTIATGDANGHVCLWDGATGVLRETALPGPRDLLTPFNSNRGGPVFSLGFANPRTLLIRSSDISVWDTVHLQRLREVESTAQFAVPIAVSPSGELFAGVMDNESIAIWNMATGEKTVQAKGASGLAFLSGDELAMSHQTQVTVINTSTGETVRRIEVKSDRINALSAPAGKRLLAGAGLQSVGIWDATTGERLSNIPVKGSKLAFSGDGRLIAIAAGHDVHVYEVMTATLLGTLSGHRGEVTGLEFMLNDRVISSSHDLSALVWALSEVVGPWNDLPKDAHRLQMDRLWKSLDSENGAEAYRAVFALAARPEEAVAMLRNRLARDVGERRIERAMAVLERINTNAAAQLRRQWVDDPGVVRDSPPARPQAPHQVVEISDVATLHRLIEAGDPSVVPSLQSRVERAVKAGQLQQLPTDLRLAIEGLGAFRVNESMSVLMKIAKDESADIVVRQPAIVALSKMRDPDTRDFLVTSLDGGVLGQKARLQVAATLAEMNIDEGRDVLIEAYEQYLAGLGKGGGGGGHIYDILNDLNDEQMIQRTLALVDRQEERTAQNNIRGTAQNIQINLKSPEDLLKMSRDTEWRKADERYVAIEALGRRGDISMIKNLQELPPWPGGSGGDNQIQQEILKEIVQDAISEIRRQHWREVSRN